MRFMNNRSVPAVITALTISDEFKQTKLSESLPNLELVFEKTLFEVYANFTDQELKKVSSLWWRFVELDNGGFFLSLESSEPIYITLPYAGKTQFRLTTHAACILSTLYTLAMLSDQFKSNRCSMLHDKLMDYGCKTPEWLIFKLGTMITLFN